MRQAMLLVFFERNVFPSTRRHTGYWRDWSSDVCSSDRIDGAGLQQAALRNLARWSATAPWTDEVSGDRRLLSSDTGDGWDAARILLPEVREHLQRELGDRKSVV